MSSERYGDWYVEFVLGTLDRERRQELEEHLPECAECRRSLDELEETLHNLPLALPEHPLPPGLKERLMAQIDDSGREPSEKPIQPGWVWPAWALAASVLALCSVGLSVYFYQQARLQELTIATLEREAEFLRTVNQGLTQRINFLTQPGLRYLTLAGLTDYEGVSASAFLNPEQGNANLFVRDLPSVGLDRSYQLWVIESGQAPHPSTVFQPTGGTTEIQLDLPIPAERVITLAITIEPQGGSPQPTGTMVAAGNL